MRVISRVIRCARKRGVARAFGIAAAFIGAALALLRAQATSDRVPSVRVPDAGAAIQTDLDSSRYHLGPVRMFPFLEIADAGYDNNIFGTADHKVSDETADVSAGTRLLLPFGPKVFFRGLAAPEYIWYARHADGRTFGGNHEAELLGLFNHLRFDADGRDSRTASLLNAETLRRVIATTRLGRGRVELDVAGPFSLFGEGEDARYRFEANPRPIEALEDPAILDRREEQGRAGVRLHAAERTSFSAAVEEVRTRFDDPTQEGDNRSTAYLAGVLLDRERFYVDLSAGYRDSRAIGGSRFSRLRTGTGSYFASYMPRPVLEVFAEGFRGVEYSVSQSPYYVSTTNAGGSICSSDRRSRSAPTGATRRTGIPRSTIPRRSAGATRSEATAAAWRSRPAERSSSASSAPNTVTTRTCRACGGTCFVSQSPCPINRARSCRSAEDCREPAPPVRCGRPAFRRMIDVHFHCLPGIDDGPASWEDAVALCRAASADGVDALVATPHVLRPPWINDDARAREAIRAELARRVDGTPKILPGCESFYREDVLDLWRRGGPLTGINGTAALLMEFPSEASWRAIESTTHEFSLLGVTLVVAHPEPTAFDAEKLGALVERGARLQITAASVCGHFGERARIASETLLRRGLVHFVASDAHSLDLRPPRLSEARDRVRKKLGAEAEEGIFEANPRALVEGLALPWVPSPAAARDRF